MELELFRRFVAGGFETVEWIVVQAATISGVDSAHNQLFARRHADRGREMCSIERDARQLTWKCQKEGNRFRSWWSLRLNPLLKAFWGDALGEP
jgi:hypothetical protein